MGLIVYILSMFHMLTLTISVRVSSRTIQAKNFKLGTHMSNELLYCVIFIWAHCSFALIHFILPFFLSLKVNLSYIFSGTVQTRIFKLCMNMLNDLLCHGIEMWAYIFFSSFVYPFFFLSLFLTLKVCVKVGIQGAFQSRIFKLGKHMNSELILCEIKNKYHCFCLLFFPSYVFSGPVFWLVRFDIYFSFYKRVHNLSSAAEL